MVIAVVYAGVSEERAISQRSGERVMEVLQKAGHTVWDVPLDTPLPSEEQMRLLARADAVFLALHGGAGENGELQAALEAYGIDHYTGSGVIASATAMDKTLAKSLVASCGIPVARGFCLTGRGEKPKDPPFLPLVAKPASGGSSIGLSLIQNEEEWRKLTPSFPVLCEEYLPGREFSVGVLGGRALPPVEIVPRGELFDYAHKYERGLAREICPSPSQEEEREALCALSLRVFAALGLRDVARIDFKEDASGTPVFLEANTLPGLTRESLLPLAARAAGISESELCVRIAEMAKIRRRD